ncbi:hypothetical protein [Vibrio phage BUCT233]|uniref:Uncharacterized protein n=1 Tax=Vibrio phage BUCT233 TaxID=2834267 RepID=A0A8E8PCU0_9CAUD|nr:hypothetical protein [Vibrio phage BUCT233]QYW05862.1 putative deoxynucleoside monophosphate kinase [Vibrio phage vB_VpP_NS8]
MIKCLILNGPPGIGKDTLAEMLRNHYIMNAFTLAVKDALYRDTAERIGMPLPKFIALASDRRTKDAPQREFGGKTPREMLIHVSEEIIKPKFGADYYGLMAGARAAEVLEYGRIPIFTDCGFAEEAVAVADAIDLSPMGGEVLVIRLNGRGCTFQGDSRNYLTVEHPAIEYMDLTVFEGEPEAACRTIVERLRN